MTFFTHAQGAVLLQLLLAHVLTDFFLQPTAWVLDKQRRQYRSPYLYVHVGLTMAVAYLLLAGWAWEVPACGAVLVIGATHYGIDLWKIRTDTRGTLRYFLLDQAAHGLVLLGCWLVLTGLIHRLDRLAGYLFSDLGTLAVLTGYLLCTTPVGYLIGKATQRWQRDVGDGTVSDSLLNAGKYIGIVERVLILTFVLLGKFEGIGFLIAAKSLLRFSETSGANAAKKSEYILFGTLLSYTLAILIGVAITRLLES